MPEKYQYDEPDALLHDYTLVRHDTQSLQEVSDDDRNLLPQWTAHQRYSSF